MYLVLNYILKMYLVFNLFFKMYLVLNYIQSTYLMPSSEYILLLIRLVLKMCNRKFYLNCSFMTTYAYEIKLNLVAIFLKFHILIIKILMEIKNS